VPVDEAETWLAYAGEDLAAAKLLVASDDLPGRLACFHAQQAVEKALKAALVARRVEFPYTHDLEVLSALQDDAVRLLLDDLDLAPLRTFAVQSRYPADAPEATAREAEAMIAVAARALRIIERALSAEPSGG
jgi:HEPN domain-containing protein